MTELIIIETDKNQKLKNFLQQENIDYKVYHEPNTDQENIFANYGTAIKNKEREKELKLWDEVDLDEELNKYGEWWN